MQTQINVGWTCPQCGRGVAPGQQTCDHGGSTQPWRLTQPIVPQDLPGCDACRRSGVCMCWRPDLHPTYAHRQYDAPLWNGIGING